MSLTDRQRAYGRGRIFRKRRKDGTEYGNFILAYYVGGRKREESSRTIDAQKATRLLNERIGTIGRRTAPAPGMHRVTIAELLDDLEALYEGEQRPSLRDSARSHCGAHAGARAVRAADLTTKKLLRFVAAQRSVQVSRGDDRPTARYAAPRANARAGRNAAEGRDGPEVPEDRRVRQRPKALRDARAGGDDP